MAQHSEIRENKVRVFLRKIMREFYDPDEDAWASPIKEGITNSPRGRGYYRDYDFKGIKISEQDETGQPQRTSIWIKRKDIPKGVLKWCDEQMGWEAPDYSFEYTGRKYYFVA